VKVSQAFIGAGWGYPVRTEVSGDVALVTGDQEVAEAIRLIIGTALGERPMRPEFGCAIHDFIFAGVDHNVAGQIAYEVRQSLVRWEPRIDVVGVDVNVDDIDRSLLYVDITYSRKGTNDRRNLVFPFYVISEEG
jgi:phage baseplate assembly protein W